MKIMNFVLTICSKVNLVCSLTVWDNAETQSTDKTVKQLHENDRYSVQFVQCATILCKHDKLVIPNDLQNWAMAWYMVLTLPTNLYSFDIKATLCRNMDKSHAKNQTFAR